MLKSSFLLLQLPLSTILDVELPFGWIANCLSCLTIFHPQLSTIFPGEIPIVHWISGLIAILPGQSSGDAEFPRRLTFQPAPWKFPRGECLRHVLWCFDVCLLAAEHEKLGESVSPHSSQYDMDIIHQPHISCIYIYIIIMCIYIYIIIMCIYIYIIIMYIYIIIMCIYMYYNYVYIYIYYNYVCIYIYIL